MILLNKHNILKKMLILLVFLIPLQTRYFFYISYIHGTFWEYGSHFIYATELLTLTILCVCLTDRDCRRGTKKVFKKYLVFPVLPLLPLLWNGLFISLNVYIHLAMAWAILPLIIILRTESLSLLLTIATSATLQAFLAIGQFIFQYSPASTLFGMASKSPEISGVSIVGTQTERMLRSYGSFPHPNILGGFLVFGIIASLLAYPQLTEQRGKKIMLVAISLETLALYTTFSRSAWLALFITLGYFFYKRPQITKNTAAKTVIIIGIFGMLLFWPFIYTRVQISSQNRFETQSRIERISYAQTALAIISTNPILGVGTGAYTSALLKKYPQAQVWNLQPVHNIYLLSIAEWGLPISILFWLSLLSLIRKKRTIIIGIIPLLIIGLFDHYLLTEYSGLQMLFLSISGIISIKKEM